MKQIFFIFFCFLPVALFGKIYDCFTFFNELEVLKIRLEELYNDVDYFVVVEATKTFSGKPKPLYFAENSATFEKYRDKIIHIVVDDFPEVTGNVETDNWAREKHQRNAIMRGLSHCSARDIIFISDVDELIRHDVINQVKIHLQKVRTSNLKKNIVALDLTNYSVQLNRTATTRWTGPVKGTRYWVVAQLTPEKLRLLHQFEPDLFTIQNAGWHFNTMGDFERALLKWQSCSTSYHLDGRSREELIQDYNNFMARHRPVPIDESFPKYIREHVDYYRSIGWIAEWK